jgi:hypothetical protein
MATIITKNSQTASAVPLAASLSVGELAVNTADGKLYTEHTGGVVKEIIPSTVADGGITTAKIVDANVTLPKLSTTGTPSSSTFLRGDGAWSTVPSLSQTDLDNLASGTAPQPKIALKAFNDYYPASVSNGSVVIYEAASSGTGAYQSGTTYLDFRSSGLDYITTDGTDGPHSVSGSVPSQFARIFLIPGTYTITWNQRTLGTSGSPGVETRLLLNGTQLVSYQNSGTTNVARSYTVTINNAFDQLILQVRRYTGSSSVPCEASSFKVLSNGDGLCIGRT